MIKVEIGQYREVNKGALKAFFSLVIYPQGIQINDCRLFQKGSARWVNLPEKEYKVGDETKYFPIVRILDKAYETAVKDAALEALKTAQPQERNGQTQNSSPTRQAHKLPAEPSLDTDELPF